MAAFLFERMMKFTIGAFTVRLWVQDDSGGAKHYARHFAFILRAAKARARGTGSCRSAAQRIIARISAINAVEVVDKKGCGTVVYRDWP